MEGDRELGSWLMLGISPARRWMSLKVVLILQRHELFKEMKSN